MDKKQKKKLKRAVKRAAKKKKVKGTAEQSQAHLKKQMNMFDRLPDACSSCKKVFPKTREAHMTWSVVVRTEKQQVRLFCPECQHRAQKLVEDQNEV